MTLPWDVQCSGMRVPSSVDEAFEVLHRVFNGGGEQVMRHGADGIAHIGDEVRVLDNDLVRRLLPKIGKLPEHLVRRAQVEGQGLVRVVKALGRQQDVAEDLILRVEEMDVTGGNDGLAQLFPQADDGAVEFPQLFFILGQALG